MTYKTGGEELTESLENTAVHARNVLAIAGIALLGAGSEFAFSSVGQTTAKIGLCALAGSALAEVGRRIFHHSNETLKHI